MTNNISKKLNHLLAAGIALAIGVLGADSALALTTQEIADKLARVPVYTMGILAGEQVTFLQESIAQENGEAVRVSRVYLNEADAANDLQDLKANNAGLPGNVEIAQVSLGEVFCISQQTQSEPCTNTPPSNEVPPAFIYFPDRQQLTQAVSRLQEQGVELGDNTPLFVPLFLAQFQVPGQEPRTVPAIYFSIDNLEADIAAAKTEQPQLANVDISIQVTTLARVIQQLKSQNDPDLNRVEFVPLRSTQSSTTPSN
ncbi:MAG: Tic22 family protein [Prochlorotrichaceae cyanobacterium]|jgi:hypothetical protein